MNLTRKLGVLKLKQPGLGTVQSNDSKPMFDSMVYCVTELTKNIQKLMENNNSFIQKLQSRLSGDKNNQQPIIISISNEKKEQGLQRRQIGKTEYAIDNSQAIKQRQNSENYTEQQLIQIQKTEQLMQDRFHLIKAKVPKNLGVSGKDESRILQILNWIGPVCKKVFSAGFSMLKSGELQVNKVKAYCSQNILGNIVMLSQKHLLTQKQFQAIDQCLKQDLLPYFCLKYPQTEEREVSKKFTELLIERDIVGQNQYDYVKKSGVKFEYEESGNYNSQIMQFLNFVISLPNRPIQKIDNRQITIGQSFHRKVEEIFKMVEQKQKKIQMLEFDPKNDNKNDAKITDSHSDKIIIQKSQTTQKTQAKSTDEKKKKYEEQYREKVKQYTSYQIGRKISENFKLFDNYEIKSGNLKLTNSTIMRVVTKWCDQLARNFDSKEFLSRDNPFRMKDGSEKYLDYELVLLLNKLLQRQYTKIQRQLERMKQNNYGLQSQFSKQKLKEEFAKYTAEQGLIGSFCSSMFKANENYLINYLNLLIHGINKALLDFQRIQRVLSKDKEFKGNQVLGQTYKKQSFLQSQQYDQITDQLIKDFSKALSETPQLIQFKVGDLLRCKCSSKQEEIIALYKEMERISLTNPKEIKILKVKNKLNQGNKDILMNLLYKETMIVEMQLAIKSEKSKFSECANKFNHYFYEMKRAQFGPIMEMCSIWSSQDTRAEFYLDKAIKLNQKKKVNVQKQSKQCCQINKNKEEYRFPFRCSQCSRFYYDCSFTQRHQFCKICKKHTCYMCRFESKTDEQKKDVIKYHYECDLNMSKIRFPKLDSSIESQIKNGAMLVNLKSKQNKVITFQTILDKDKCYLFHQVQKSEGNGQMSKELQLISQFRMNKIPEQLLMSNIIFTYDDIKQVIPVISLQRAQDEYFAPKLLQKINKLEKRQISLIQCKISQRVLTANKSIRQLRFDRIQKVNLSKNKFTSLKQISEKFVNAEEVILNYNNIAKLDKEQTLKWKKIRKLDINHNLISQISGGISSLSDLQNIACDYTQLKTLKIMRLSYNQIKHLPDQFRKLKSVAILDIDNNLLQSLPDWFGELSSLTVLDICWNKLKTLPQSFGQLSFLTTLNAYNNQLEKLPTSFGNLKSLSKLNIVNNKFQQLPQSFGQLNLLLILYFSMNRLKKLPQSIGQLKLVTQLALQCNQLKHLPESFGQLSQLQTLFLVQNKLQTLPQSFGKLHKLKALWLQQNQLKQLPQSLKQLRSLQQMQINNNKLRKIPNIFGQLHLLKQLKLEFNLIQQLPQSIGSLMSVKQIHLNHNKLRCLPQSFGKLKALRCLYIQSNALQRLPQSFSQLDSLDNLDISYNSIKQFPQNFGQLKSLSSLYFYTNQITKLPESFKKLKLGTFHGKLNYIKQFPNFNNFKSLLLIQTTYSGDFSQIIPSVNQLSKLKLFRLEILNEYMEQNLEHQNRQIETLKQYFKSKGIDFKFNKQYFGYCTKIHKLTPTSQLPKLYKNNNYYCSCCWRTKNAKSCQAWYCETCSQSNNTYSLCEPCFKIMQEFVKK